MLFCTNCGTQLAEGTKVCPNCGVINDDGNQDLSQQLNQQPSPLSPPSYSNNQQQYTPEQQPFSAPLPVYPEQQSYSAPPPVYPDQQSYSTPPPVYPDQQPYSAPPPVYPASPYVPQWPHMTRGKWMITQLLLLIPIANIVLIFVWAFGSDVNPSKKAYFQAQLIWILIGIAFSVITLVVASTFVAALFSSLGDIF